MYLEHVFSFDRLAAFVTYSPVELRGGRKEFLKPSSNVISNHTVREPSQNVLTYGKTEIQTIM